MLNVGMTELLVFGVIALLVLGPEKLPEAARFAGKWYGYIKRLIGNVQQDIDRELRLSELREEMQNEMRRLHEVEQQMQSQILQLQHDKIIDDDQLTYVKLDNNQENKFPIYQFVKANPQYPLSKTGSQVQKQIREMA
jgi:sec-independent protein translocase protein TatB